MDYNKMPVDAFITKLLNSTDLCPCLLIGRYVNEFKRQYKGSIHTIYSLENVRNLLETFSMLHDVNSKYLVLEGIGYLSDVGQNALLKFIEESKIPIILLSYNDKISPIILSRMKLIVKRWYPVKSLKFVRPKEFEKILQAKKESEEVKEYEEIQLMADNCPSYFALKLIAGNPYNSTTNRIRKILLNI